MLAPISVEKPRITNENPYVERKPYRFAKRRKKKKTPLPSEKCDGEHIDLRV